MKNSFLVYVGLVGIVASIQACTAWAEEALTLEKALQFTITQQAEILHSELNREIYHGRLTAAGADFDARFSAATSYSDARTPLTPTQSSISGYSTADSRIQNHQISWSKTYRSGVNLSSSLALVNTTDDTYGADRSSTRKLGLTLSLPFYDLVENNASSLREQAAQETLRGVVYDHYHQIATSLYQTTVAWWNAVAAQKRVQIYHEAVEKTQQSLRDYRKLIAAGERPESDINQLKANHVSIKRQLVSEKKILSTAHFALTHVIGLPEYTEIQIEPHTPWPTWEQRGDISTHCGQHFDLLAAEATLESMRLAQLAGYRDLRPDLDLFFTVEGAQSANSLWRRDSDDNIGRTVLAGLRFTEQVDNAYAKGTLQELRSRYQQAKIALQELQRTIAIDSRSAQDKLKFSLEAAQLADQTVALYQKALKTEQQKLTLGMSTVLDVIATFDNLRYARLSQVNSYVEYAQALAEAKYTSGKTILLKNDMIHVNLQDGSL